MQESGDGGFSLVPVVEGLCGGQRAPAVRHTLGCMLGVSCFTSPSTYISVSPGNDSHTPEQRWCIVGVGYFLFTDAVVLPVYSPCAFIYTLTPVVITLWTVLFQEFQRTTKQTTSATGYISAQMGCMHEK